MASENLKLNIFSRVRKAGYDLCLQSAPITVFRALC